MSHTITTPNRAFPLYPRRERHGAEHSAELARARRTQRAWEAELVHAERRLRAPVGQAAVAGGPQ